MISIDKTLTPENAVSRGYIWWKDTIYDTEAPLEAMQDIVDMTNCGYVLGKCATPDGEQNNFVGVYIPKAKAT